MLIGYELSLKKRVIMNRGSVIIVAQEGLLVSEISKMPFSACTVLSPKSDGDVMFCLQSYQGLNLDRSLVY